MTIRESAEEKMAITYVNDSNSCNFKSFTAPRSAGAHSLLPSAQTLLNPAHVAASSIVTPLSCTSIRNMLAGSQFSRVKTAEKLSLCKLQSSSAPTMRLCTLDFAQSRKRPNGPSPRPGLSTLTPTAPTLASRNSRHASDNRRTTSETAP